MSGTTSGPTIKDIDTRAYYGLTVGLGLAGGLLAAALAGFSLASVLGAVVLVLAGALAGSVLAAKQQAALNDVNRAWRGDEEVKLKDLEAYVVELERLFLQVVPILLRQVQTSRTHTEQEITVLTDRFAAMVPNWSVCLPAAAATAKTGVSTCYSTKPGKR